MNRRRFLAVGASAALAGCSSSADTSDGNTTGTDTSEPSTVDGFVDALEGEGIRVDSTMSLAGGVSVMYYRDPDSHGEQIRTLARVFADHRTIVDPDSLLAFTALSSATERHGEGHITREWADRYARGDLGDSEYFQNVRDTYRTL